MKTIGLISDTHSFLDPRVLHHFEQVDEILHAGDVGDLRIIDALERIAPVRAVYGNIDDQQIRAELPLHQKFTLEGIKVWMTHIGGYPPRYSPRILKGLEVIRPGLFICGHSHICKIKFDKGRNCLHMNPGAAGNHGFHKVRTLIRFQLNKTAFENVSVIELGPKNFDLSNAID